MEWTTLFIIFILLFGVIGGILILLDKDNNSEYKYKCHHCKKKFKESDIKDLRGPWHTKDWTCPHCKHLNVTLKGYDY